METFLFFTTTVRGLLLASYNIQKAAYKKELSVKEGICRAILRYPGINPFKEEKNKEQKSIKGMDQKIEKINESTINIFESQ